MAIILLGKTRCALCAMVLKEGDDLVATSHFIADQQNPLWRYSDAAMHRHCFLAWDQRQRFVDTYNAAVGPITWGDGTYHQMTDDGRILSLRRDA